MDDKDRKCQQLPVLKTQKIKYIQGKGDDPNTIYMGVYDYPDIVWKWHDLMYKLELTDIDYGENLAKLRDKSNCELTRDEILTKLTFILRGEHFDAGSIAEALESGELEELTTRLNQITK